jgi:hypothetical protein
VGNSDANIYLDAPSAAVITNFSIGGTGQNDGIVIVNSGREVFISQGTIVDTRNGIVIKPGVHNVISNVSIKGSTRSGIYIDADRACTPSNECSFRASTNNSILNAFIAGNGKGGPSGRAGFGTSGVELQNALLTKVMNNTIVDECALPPGVPPGTPHPCPAFQTYGVYMGEASQGTIVSNNILSPNLIDAFADFGLFNRVYGNSEKNYVPAGDINIIIPLDDFTHVSGTFVFTGKAFSDLEEPPLDHAPDGSLLYCKDCQVSSICTGAGTGAFAKRLNGMWVCN